MVYTLPHTLVQPGVVVLVVLMVLLVLVFLVILGLPRDMLQRVMLPSGMGSWS